MPRSVHRSLVTTSYCIMLSLLGAGMAQWTPPLAAPPGESPAAGGGRASGSAPSAAGPTRSYIVVFKGPQQASMLNFLCAEGPGSARRLGLPASCTLTGVCRRVYNTTLIGISGHFQQQQLNRLYNCFKDGIAYIEEDLRVFKAEGPNMGLGFNLHSPDETPSLPSFNPLARGATGPWGPGRSLKGNLADPAEPQVLSADRDGLTGLRTDAPSSAAMNFTIVATNVTNAAGPSLGTGSIPILNGIPLHVPTPAEMDSRPGLKVQELHPALWNLDRIDQRGLPLDGKYIYGVDPGTPGLAGKTGTGQGATVYVVDSGIRKSHQEFGDFSGGPSRASYGWDFVEDDGEAADCDGHGTHVAGTAVGRTVGVAKRALVVAVRVLDCSGSGSISDTIAGLEWVAQYARRPAIVTLSLGIAVGQWSKALEDSVRSLVAQGISVVVASGNSQTDACFIAPANVETAVTVAASNLDNKFAVPPSQDARETLYKYSNTGPCIDILAPGTDIYSACGGASRCTTVSDSSYAWSSGTSMAVPHVAAALAIYLGDSPGDSPAAAHAALIAGGSRDKIDLTSAKPQTPNVLVNTQLAGLRVQASNGDADPGDSTGASPSP